MDTKFHCQFSKTTNKYWLYSYLSAGIQASVPTIDQLVPIIDTTNRYSVVAGNPNLKVGKITSLNYYLNIDRSNPKAKSGYGIRINSSYAKTQNAIVDSTVYDASGKSIRYLLNMNGQNRFNINGDIHFSTKFNNNNQIQATYTPSYNNNNSPGYINGIISYSHNQAWGNSISISFIILNKFYATIGENITNTKNKQDGASNLSTEIKNMSTSIDATYTITKGWNISSNFQYQTNTATTNKSYASIWNATSTYRFMHDKAELKLTAFDLLHQNKNIINFLNQNSIGTTVTNGLRQYFILSFSYYPRKF